jgi:hypothetical protein
MGLVTGLALGAAAIGTAVSASSANRNARRAAQTSSDNNAANVALSRDIYNQNRQIMSPFVNRGNVAGNQINALLGLGGGMETGGPAAVGPNALANLGGVNWGPSDGRYTMGYGDWVNQNMGGANPAAYGDAGLPYGLGDNFIATNTGGAATTPTGTVTTPLTAQQAAENAFNTFRNSTGYQNRFNSAMDGVSSLYSGIGGLQSGAAIRGAQDRAADVAANEFNNYMAMLGGQQAVGAGSASALAGVGQNFAGTVINSNNLNAQNQMNAQLGQQNAFGNALGVLGGGYLGMGR